MPLGQFLLLQAIDEHKGLPKEECRRSTLGRQTTQDLLLQLRIAVGRPVLGAEADETVGAGDTTVVGGALIPTRIVTVGIGARSTPTVGLQWSGLCDARTQCDVHAERRHDHCAG